jgi:micrococcal nuclease
MSSPFKQQYVYNGICNRVIDGDTIEVTVDLGFNVAHKVRVRLINVNAAEIFRGTDTERQKGQLAKQFMTNLVLDKAVILRTEKDTVSFNRYLGEAWLFEQSQQSINEVAQQFYTLQNLING